MLPAYVVARRIAGLAWQYRGRCVVALFYQVLLLGLGLGGLGLTGLAIDVLRHELDAASPPPAFPFGLSASPSWSPMATLTAIAGGIVAVAVLTGVLRYLASASTALLSQRIIARLRADVFERIQRLSFRYFDIHDVSSTINRVAVDVSAFPAFIDGVILRVFITLLSLSVYLGYMLSVHVPLTLSCLAVSPLLWLTAVVFSRSVQPDFMRVSRLVDRVVMTLTENIQGIHVVKGFVRHREQEARFAAANRDVRDQQHTIFWKISLFQPTMGLLTQLSTVVLLAYGGWLVIHGQLPLGAGLFVFSGLLQEFANQVGRITDVANSIQSSLAGARRVFRVLDAPLETVSPPHAVRRGRLRGSIRFEHVGFGYQHAGAGLDGRSHVLRDVSFEIQPGEFVAVVGATGSGKSTLLGLIPRFYDVSRGRVLIDGVDVRSLDLDDLRRGVGTVFQETFLFSDTVAANIAFGRPGASPEQIDRAARVAAARPFILDLPDGYETMLQEQGSNLSGGQRQRLALARAMLLDPPILILDDATAAVDPGVESEIWEAIHRAMAGRTTLLATHRIAALARADRILVLDRGRIEQMGTHESLLATCERYRRLAALQSMPHLAAPLWSLPTTAHGDYPNFHGADGSIPGDSPVGRESGTVPFGCDVARVA